MHGDVEEVRRRLHMFNFKPEWRDVDNGGVVNRGRSWKSDESPLALAVRYGHAEVVRAMLDPCWKGLKNEVSTVGRCRLNL